MAKKVCILDYGSGNVMSVYNMIKFLGYDVKVSNSNYQINASSHIILPGVGSFSSSMKKIKNNIPLKCVEDNIFNKKKPFLGICVGMQVLANYGYEFEKCEGLGWIGGNVKMLKTSKYKIPHIGWNNINVTTVENKLFKNCKDENFYFVHSFCIDEINKNLISSYTDYESNFISSLKKDNIYGVQFHPEKSQIGGLTLCKNFMEEC